MVMRLRSPMICNLLAGSPGNPGVSFWKLEGPSGKSWLRAGEDQCLNISSQAERVNSLFLHLFLFYSSPQRIGSPTPIGEGNLLYLVHGFKCQSHPDTHAHRHSQKPCLIWSPLVSVKLTHKIDHYQPSSQNLSILLSGRCYCVPLLKTTSLELHTGTPREAAVNYRLLSRSTLYFYLS